MPFIKSAAAREVFDAVIYNSFFANLGAESFTVDFYQPYALGHKKMVSAIAFKTAAKQVLINADFGVYVFRPDDNIGFLEWVLDKRQCTKSLSCTVATIRQLLFHPIFWKRGL